MGLSLMKWCRSGQGVALIVALSVAALACSDDSNTAASVAAGGGNRAGVDVAATPDTGASVDSTTAQDGNAAEDGTETLADSGMSAGDIGGATDSAGSDAAADGQGVLLDAGSGASDAMVADADEEPVQCLGTIYPNEGQIDPDKPVYSSEWQTQEETEKAFAQAKADGTNAYKAYKAAFDNPEVLLCAFCPCGCHESNKHQSAMDCFKDMHGFG